MCYRISQRFTTDDTREERTMATKTTAPKQTTKAPVKDLPVKTAQDVKGGVRGGCDEWGCGTNHNETLLRA
jgi:hypothetical protein